MHVAIVRHVYNRFDMANCLIRISIQAAAMSMHSITVYKISGAGSGGRGNRNNFYHSVYIKRGGEGTAVCSTFNGRGLGLIATI